MKGFQICIITGLILSVAACVPAPSTAAVTPAPSPAVQSSVAPEPVATPTAQPNVSPAPLASVVPADGLVSFSGSAASASQAFHLSAAATVKVIWQYSGREAFTLWLVNDSEELDDPAYDRILVTDVTGSEAGEAAVPLIAGDYVVEVERADGHWTVRVVLEP